MNGSISEVDAQRERWARYRAELDMTEARSASFATGGLGQHVEDLDTRILILPSDPLADDVSLGGELLGWLKSDHPNPYGGEPPRWGLWDVATSDALVLFDILGSEEERWYHYLAIHRHGGLEFGSGDFRYEHGRHVVFSLRNLVGVVWHLMTMQLDAATRWHAQLPWELTVALRGTAGATLGVLAEGWTEPGPGSRNPPRCLEAGVMIRLELEERPDPAAVAFAVGDRIENAFGSTHRRYLANRGDFDGDFDPRFGW